MVSQEQIEQYVPTIGIECHVQFNTATKLFAAVDNDERDKGPNQTVSPLCFGLPGTLPVLNKQAVELAIMAGAALQARINKISSFDRKHYFYPDLPKGYQITQLESPIVGAGHIDVPLDGTTVKVRIHHAHLEEDAGKSTHPAGQPYSLVDLNRAGTPLLEIVSEADMHSAAEAKAYAQELYLLMKYAGVTYGDLQHGNMRFDVNVSIAKPGQAWGTRCEVKNLNSFRAVERAVEYEVKRQAEILEKGGQVIQETRGWDEAKQRTVAQRSKEQAMDYRYFPEPDVPPVVLTDAYIQSIQDKMPPLPHVLRKTLNDIGVSAAAAEVLIMQDALNDLGAVQTVLSVRKNASTETAVFTANFIINRFVKHAMAHPGASLPLYEQFIATYDLFAAKELSSNAADTLLFALAEAKEADARTLAQQKGLLQENNQAALEAIVDELIASADCAQAVADVRAGEMKALGFLVGQAMKASKGKANPAAVNELLRKKLQN